MSLIHRISHHRVTAIMNPRESPEWYAHMAKAAELTREWRVSNTLSGVNAQTADRA